MGQKTLEELIREYPIYQLEEVVGEKRKNFSEEAIAFAEDELILRKIISLNPIEQIDFIKTLNNHQLDFIIQFSNKYYPSSILNVIQVEYAKRGMEENEWYYLDNNKPIGPIKLSELKKLAEYGSLFPYSLVFRQGIQNWVAANSVPGLFDFVNTNLPPPPPNYPGIPFYAQQQNPNESKESTELGCGLSIICVLFPLIGVILFFTEKNDKGKNALALAFVGFIIGIILYFIYFQALWN